MMKGLWFSGVMLGVFLCSCSLIGREKSSCKVLTGLDVLEREDFALLKGKRIGLISNHSALDHNGLRILDLMLSSKNVNLKAIFAPEHGFKGIADARIKDMKEAKTGLPIYSLYGKQRRPSKEKLKDIDVLVFDIQDIGARFYTYISTMAMCMEAAAENNTDFYVLDRPNPITGLRVGGPIQDEQLYRRFTSYFPMPVIHGMTIGELAKMFNEYYGIQCNLTVVRMEGWKRKMFFDETVLKWVNPSPNMRSVTEEILYPGIALAEGSNVSVGRGTDTPFEVFGAPWIDAEKLVAELDSRNLQGIEFTPYHFIPTASKFKGEKCNGFKITLTDRTAFDSISTGLNLLSALYKLYPDTFKIDQNYGLIGSKDVIERIKKGQPIDLIRASYKANLEKFIKARNNYVLYRE